MQENALLQDLETLGDRITLSNLALNNDKKLFAFMLNQSPLHQAYKTRFFTHIDSILVFKQQDFLQFLDSKLLNNSYTKYTNKIGLGYKNKFIKANTQVVLNFPFKDCVFKGNANDNDTKSEEIFFNDIIARDEIDVLFSPKALCDFEFIGDTNGWG